MLYRAISFVVGLTLMSFELVAARILAPSIGSSTYIWTNVIGVILGAMALGYFYGGKRADEKQQVLDIANFCLLAAAAMTAALVLHKSLTFFLASTLIDARLQGLIAALVLFAPASFVFGAISPLLVRFSVKSLQNTGKQVAALSAFNTIGGIVGTFLTGFFLFSYLGSNNILLSLIILMVVISFFIETKTKFWDRLAWALLTVLVALWFSLDSDLAKTVSIDTASAHYEIATLRWYDEKKIVGLRTGPTGIQSGRYTDGNPDLVFWYTQQISEVIDQQINTTEANKILILGGGAFTLPEFLAKKYPHSQIEVVEIDPALITIAQKYFYFDPPSNLKIISADARAFVNQEARAGDLYDFIVVDIYSDSFIPWQFITKEFGDNLARLLKTNGTVIVNVIASIEGACTDLFQAINSTYAPNFISTQYRTQIARSDSRGNMILVYGPSNTSIDGYNPIPTTPLVVYTDNFAPIERLTQKCLSSQ